MSASTTYMQQTEMDTVDAGKFWIKSPGTFNCHIIK